MGGRHQFHLICISTYRDIPCVVITTSGALEQNKHAKPLVIWLPLNIFQKILFSNYVKVRAPVEINIFFVY